MKVLTLRQPWAWAVLFADPVKDIENRTWKTNYRGTLAIHAGMGYDGDDLFAYPSGVVFPSRSELTFGAILGTVELVDVITKSSSPWFGGPFGFVLENPTPLDEPVPMKGRLGLWDTDAL